MPRILSFTSGPHDWKQFLADPEKKWKPGYSACTLAHCWEHSDGFPPEVNNALSQRAEPLLANLDLLLAVPEFKVHLPGGTRPSQNDIFVLARSSAGPICIMVEGKVNESFGPTLTEWLIDASPGKNERLDFLLRTLSLPTRLSGDIRYQLLHRAASAIITGEQYHAKAAIVLVHSFSKENAGWKDYEAFIHLFGVNAERNVVQRLAGATSIPLFGAWVTGNLKFLDSGREVEA